VIALQNIWDIDLNYKGVNNETTCFSSGSLVHPYPAKAMPNMVNDLLTLFQENYQINTVLDPFCGSGTVALESKLLGLDFYGSDLSPLAVLIAKTKTLTVDNKSYAFNQIEKMLKDIAQEKYPKYPLVHFKNIDYWFVERNIQELSFLKYKINNFLKNKGKYKEIFASILLTAFSSTVREVCLSRKGEFKLYRIPEAEIKNWDVDTYSVFSKKISNLFDLLKETNSYAYNTTVEVQQANAKELSYLDTEHIDAILTSPPYGDSRSTVAYGQFARLPIQWMDDLLLRYLNIKVEAADCDDLLLGGKKSDIDDHEEIRQKIILESKHLQSLLDNMNDTIKNEVTIMNQFVAVLNNLSAENQSQYINEITDNAAFINRFKSYIKKRIEKDRVFDKKFYFKEVRKYLDFARISKGKAFRRTQSVKKIVENLVFSYETKIKALPNRKVEVLNFFIDLYQAFNEADRVLKKGGVQGWIIGNRTVLGNINVPLSDILSDWFEARSYSKITALTRQYSFKRLPHHMNSSIDRDKKISSMMEEYIIVYRKN